ncbi:MAG TPA: phosphopantetheine-binding protein [Gemmataceae bacterium]|jgi:acyl carrier protein
MTAAERVMADLAAIVERTFPDRDFPEVDGQSRAFADLGLASIDLVVLAEQLELHYGKKLSFGMFLKSLRDRGADDVILGELVVFLQRHL